MFVDRAGGARGERQKRGGMKSAPGRLGEGPHLLASKGGGQQFGGVQVKVEDTDGSYDCAICFESVRRSADALHCSQCSSNPFHGACLLQSGFADTCPQCCGSTLVAGVRASGDAARIDLTEEAAEARVAANALHLEHTCDGCTKGFGTHQVLYTDASRSEHVGVSV